MCKCSHGETGNEFFANFPVFWPIRACFGAFAHVLGALMPPILESFACAPSTNWPALNLVGSVTATRVRVVGAIVMVESGDMLEHTHRYFGNVIDVFETGRSASKLPQK